VASESSVRNVFVIVAFAYLSIACESAPPREKVPPPRSRWNESYNYSWDPPAETHPASGMAVCIVRPNYGNDADSILKDSNYRKFAKGFGKSMAVDLDKTLVTKGIRAMGPFETYDDITYPEKQSADLALTPQVFLAATIKYLDAPPGDQFDYVPKNFRMDVQGFVTFELREPLSKEKLWVKKLELEPETTEGIEAYESIANYDGNGTLTGYSAGKLLYDGKQDAMADIMQKWYPVIMQKAWTYLNIQEMQAMRPQIEEIRKMKRY
jgi:hypothetical protein